MRLAETLRLTAREPIKTLTACTKDFSALTIATQLIQSWEWLPLVGEELRALKSNARALSPLHNATTSDKTCMLSAIASHHFLRNTLVGLIATLSKTIAIMLWRIRFALPTK